MTTKELERKYDLHLGDHTFDSSDYWSWKVEHRARPIEFWADVSKDPDLTYNFIKLYKEFLYWDVLVYDKFYQDINFVREFWNRIDWWKFSERFVELNDESTIREFIDFIEVGKHGIFDWNISLNFIREFNEKIKWFDTTNNVVHATSALKKVEVCDEFANEILDIGSRKPDLSSRHNFFPSLKFGKKMFIRCFGSRVLNHLVWYDVLDEETLEDYIIPKQKNNKEIMEMIFMQDTLSIEFIERHIDIINNLNLWSRVCQMQNLNEEFIDKYKDKVKWKDIVEYQNLSENFIEKHLDYIKGFSTKLLQYKDLSEQFIEKHIDIFKLLDLARFGTFSEEFKEKYFKHDSYLYSLVQVK